MPDDVSSVFQVDLALGELVEGSAAARPTAVVRAANKRAPTPADAAVGRRIRDYRVAVGMALAELSSRVGVSQPQLYRYESGLTRVAASRLIAISDALGVSVEALTSRGDAAPLRKPGGGTEVDLLLRAFNNIGRPERRSALIALARSMADTDAAPAA